MHLAEVNLSGTPASVIGADRACVGSFRVLCVRRQAYSSLEKVNPERACNRHNAFLQSRKPLCTGTDMRLPPLARREAKPSASPSRARQPTMPRH